MAFPCARLSVFTMASLLTALTFAGCTSPETSPLPESATVTAKPQATSVPDTKAEAPVATMLPTSCAEVLPDSALKRAEPRIELFDTAGELVVERLEFEVGPLTMATLLGGEQQLYCAFGIRQTDGGGNLGIAVITEQAKAELLEALRSSVYLSVDPRAAEFAFFQGPSADHRYSEEVLIDGDVLIVVPHTVGGDFAWDALSSIQ